MLVTVENKSLKCVRGNCFKSKTSSGSVASQKQGQRNHLDLQLEVSFVFRKHKMMFKESAVSLDLSPSPPLTPPCDPRGKLSLFAEIGMSIHAASDPSLEPPPFPYTVGNDHLPSTQYVKNI